MKQIITLTIVAVILVGVVLFLFSQDTGERPLVLPSPTPTPTVEKTPVLSPETSPTPKPSPTPSVSKVTVTYSDSGYSPPMGRIKKGNFIVFENKSSKMMWTASAVHPTHKAYPGSGIEMCGTNTLVAIFDACKGYGPGESWEFRFDEQGAWKYHNHLQPNHTGTIVVE